MPPPRSLRRPSFQLEAGDAAGACTPNTGRPVRNRRSTVDASPFVDSAIAVSDPEDDLEDGHADTISVSHRRGRKRKRTPSPPMSDLSSSEDSDGSATAVATAVTTTRDLSSLATAAGEAEARQIVIKDLTINLPPSHTGPIVIHLDAPPPITSTTTLAPDPSHSMPAVQPSGATLPTKRRAVKRTRQAQPASASHPPDNRVGFLSLPAELRNQIYRLVFVTSSALHFETPFNFSRSAALLRTCKQVYSEARGILYSENHFIFARRTSRRGSYWAKEWNEVGFKAVRKFIRSIGTTNVALLRHVSLTLHDATPCLNPALTTADERRFVNDEVLISVLRRLAEHGRLRRVDLHFHGRRRVERSDKRFLKALTDVKADRVTFLTRYPDSVFPCDSKQGAHVEKMCIEAMTRRRKLYD